MRHSRSFTLIELLVVVAIIAVLISILVPSLQDAREMAKRLDCMAKIRHVGVVNHIYATDHHGYLILNAFSNCVLREFWATQEAVQVYEDMLGGHEAAKRFFYPDKRMEDAMGFWWENVDRKIGIVVLGGNIQPDPVQTWRAKVPYTPWIPGGLTPIMSNTPEQGVAPADQLLAGDITEIWCQTPGDVYSYYLAGTPFTYPTFAHVERDGRTPAGGNCVYNDGHGSWVDFENMQQRPSTADWYKWW